MYKLLRNFLFLFDPEKVHYFSMNSLKLLCRIPFVKKIISRQFSVIKPQLNKKFLGIDFKNPVGLGAGFDKNAEYLNELSVLGFGFVEIGTVTPKPQSGNDKPRLFRLPKDKALINRMGFNNEGVEVVAERLKRWAMVNGEWSMVNGERLPRAEPGIGGNEQLAISNAQLTIESFDNDQDNRQLANQQATVQLSTHSPFTIHHSPRLIIGGNIGKNKITPNEDAWKDYEICFKALHPYVDYFVVNVSSPNTPGLRELQEKESLRKILTNLQAINLAISNGQLAMDNKQFANQQAPEKLSAHSPFIIHHSRPILLKIAPDLTHEQIDDVVDLALEIKLDGLVVSNTTISRVGLVTAEDAVAKMGAGGLSGLPVKEKSTQLVKYIQEKTNGQLPLIASGGIFTAIDAREKMNAGASLVQVWTGFIYEGPAIVKNICNQL